LLIVIQSSIWGGTTEYLGNIKESVRIENKTKIIGASQL